MLPWIILYSVTLAIATVAFAVSNYIAYVYRQNERRLLGWILVLVLATLVYASSAIFVYVGGIEYVLGVPLVIVAFAWLAGMAPPIPYHLREN